MTRRPQEPPSGPSRKADDDEEPGAESSGLRDQGLVESGAQDDGMMPPSRPRARPPRKREIGKKRPPRNARQVTGAEAAIRCRASGSSREVELLDS